MKNLCFLCVLVPSFCFNYVGTGFASDQRFFEWVEVFREEAVATGINSTIIDQALAEVKLLPRVIELDRNQPEGRQTFATYLQRVVPRSRVNAARERLRKHHELLQLVANDYQVQPRFIVALWGIESDFGRYTGGFSVINALATLAYDGRRDTFFRAELIDALRILEQEEIPLSLMTGSWAGAMGQSQFMPSSYHRFAIDHDQDGHRDIWSSHADIFASIANYLHSSNWQYDQTWGRKVLLPEMFDDGLTGIQNIKTITYWQELGVRRTDGKDLPTRQLDASIVLPDGIDGDAFMVYQNFHFTLAWNRSIYFALAVGILADRMLEH